MDQVEGGAEHIERASAISPNGQSGAIQSSRVEQAPVLGSSSSTTQAIKGGDSTCGDALGLADALEAVRFLRKR